MIALHTAADFTSSKPLQPSERIMAYNSLHWMNTTIATTKPQLVTEPKFNPTAAAIERMIYIVIYSTVFTAGLIENSISVWVFCSRMKTKTITSIYMLNLAIADLCLIMTLPLRITYHILESNWPFGETACRITGFLFHLDLYSSVYFLTCISIDRYLAIVHPVRSLSFRKVRYAKIISATVWVTAILGTFQLAVTTQSVQAQENTTVCLQLYREKPSLYASGALIVGFLFPFLVIICCYLCIIKHLQSYRRLDHKHKASRMIFTVLTVFLVCFLPYHVARLLYIIMANQHLESTPKIESLAIINRAFFCLASINCCLDPVVYFFVGENFRESLYREEKWKSTTEYNSQETHPSVNTTTIDGT
ncbi:uracil nucleotide/cysteinyl leukotriene receptor-like [Stegostoma tigrinum]|uniref:uracil nucleotide/cysteinyl leukotriene receptor-like n=1 Tax=Stegostoma tigrinum TaxID=3053191 RepID=UPI00202B1860|nr:uracil nucleotide/cysteinyl leukotriene receptor-like [Stegostoma tigrinum]